jgi:hypothetical protein
VRPSLEDLFLELTSDVHLGAGSGQGSVASR